MGCWEGAHGCCSPPAILCCPPEPGRERDPRRCGQQRGCPRHPGPALPALLPVLVIWPNSRDLVLFFPFFFSLSNPPLNPCPPPASLGIGLCLQPVPTVLIPGGIRRVFPPARCFAGPSVWVWPSLSPPFSPPFSCLGGGWSLTASVLLSLGVHIRTGKSNPPCLQGCPGDSPVPVIRGR